MKATPITVDVRQKLVQLARSQMGWTRDEFTKVLLREWLQQQLRAGPDSKSGLPFTSVLQDEIDAFAERRAKGAVANLLGYFADRGLAGRTVGGRAAVSAPLLYRKDRLLPSASDIAAIGEGLAGWYLEQVEGLRFEVRPFLVSPDLIFRNPPSTYVLAEVKTTLETGSLEGELVSTSISLIDLMTKTQLIRKYCYLGYAISVRAVAPDRFELYRLALEEV